MFFGNWKRQTIQFELLNSHLFGSSVSVLTLQFVNSILLIDFIKRQNTRSTLFNIF